METVIKYKKQIILSLIFAFLLWQIPIFVQFFFAGMAYARFN